MEIRIACYVYFQGKNLIERLHVTAAVQNMNLMLGFDETAGLAVE